MWLPLLLLLPLLLRAAPDGPDVDTPSLANNSGCTCKTIGVPLAVFCFDRLACVRFPRNVTVPPRLGLATLYVRVTRIAELVPGDLSRLQHLTELSVDGSAELSRVVPGTFLGLAALANLSLSFLPRLTHLEADALEGLVSLRRLTLVRCGFAAPAAVVPALAPAALPRLQALRLDDNPLRALARDDLAAMRGSPLEELSVAGCELSELHPAALAPLKRLSALGLAGNDLDDAALAECVDQLAVDGVALRYLDLASVGLSFGQPTNATAGSTCKTLHAVARAGVVELTLRGNEAARLGPGSLPRLAGLRRLDLSRVSLAEGMAGALADDVVPDLQALNLSGNRLSVLRPGFLSHRLLSLDLSAVATAYFDLGEPAFHDMASLQVLHLANSRLVRLTNQSLQGLTSLKVLTLHNASLFRLDLGVFLPLEHLEHLDLQRNLFTLGPPLHPDVFLGLGRLKVLLLGDVVSLRSLGADTFRHLEGLEHLGLQSNALATLDGSRLFYPLRALRRLDLSQNRIGSWRSARLFAHNKALRELRATGNTITYLSDAMLQDLQDLEVVDLADNTFHCGCELYRPLRPKLPGLDSNVSSHLLVYKCLSPDRWWNHTIADFVHSPSTRSACTDTPSTLLLVALPLLLCVLLGLAVAYRFRHQLRYRLEAAAVRAPQATPGELGSHTNYQYDAFVSYSSEDQDFVRLLVAALEDQEPCFRLCVYERDFTAGAAIAEAVLTSVALSRRVVLVVSAAFVRSHWCAWEAHVALHQRLAAADALLVIRLGLLDQDELSPTLRYLLGTRIYLEWPDDSDTAATTAFWRKLRAALSQPVRALL